MGGEMDKKLIRACRAHEYLDMGRYLFDREIRPLLTAIEIGESGVFFDRLEMDSVVDQIKARRPRKEEKCTDSLSEAGSITSAKPSRSKARGKLDYAKVRANLTNS
jgi:hypothetical protein